MEFYEEIEYLIDLLEKNDSNINDTDRLNRLEKILEEYANKYHQQNV